MAAAAAVSSSQAFAQQSSARLSSPSTSFLQALREHHDEDSFDTLWQQFMFANEYDREHSVQDNNSWEDDPGLVVSQTTETQSCDSHSPSVDPAQGHHAASVPLLNLSETKELDDRLTYPQLPEDNPPPRYQQLSLPAGRPSSSSSSSGPSRGTAPTRQPRRPGRPGGNGDRPRRLQDPEDTAQVRGAGACIRCRIEKTKVGALFLPSLIRASALVVSCRCGLLTAISASDRVNVPSVQDSPGQPCMQSASARPCRPLDQMTSVVRTSTLRFSARCSS